MKRRENRGQKERGEKDRQKMKIIIQDLTYLCVWTIVPGEVPPATRTRSVRAAQVSRQCRSSRMLLPTGDGSCTFGLGGQKGTCNKFPSLITHSCQ